MFSRRDFLRVTGATGASFMLAHSLAGCTDSPPPSLPEDPEGRWWLSGNYAPVDNEIEAFDLEVEGNLPPELNGLFLRDGANPRSKSSLHWFTGDGMLHGVRLEAGRALWYRNRYVQTLAYESNSGDSLAANRANTAVKAHAGKLLALYEAGVPHEISAADLSTLGEYDFAGELQRPMSAHPKIDPVTGEMFFIGYAPFPPYLTYHVIDANGALVRSVEVDIGHSAMMHDMQITESHGIICDLPIRFDNSLLADGFPFRWVDDAPARIGVIPRDGSSGSANWIEIDQCFMFHTFNAYETNTGKIVLEGCRLPHLWRNSVADASATPTPWSWEIDVKTGNVSEGPMHERSADFPQIDLRRTGREHRMAYSLRFDESGERLVATPNGISKFDRTTGVEQLWDAGRNHQPDEPMFVPFGDAEDDGYVLSMVFDRTTARSYVAVLDAKDMSAGPIARIHMPRRVPFGFHGAWLGDGVA